MEMRIVVPSPSTPAELDDTAAGSAEMWLGENTYRIARWAPRETWQ